MTLRLINPQLSWEVDGRLHSLTFEDTTGTYCSPDGEIIEMPREGWLALVEAATRLTNQSADMAPPAPAALAKPKKPLLSSPCLLTKNSARRNFPPYRKDANQQTIAENMGLLPLGWIAPHPTTAISTASCLQAPSAPLLANGCRD